MKFTNIKLLLSASATTVITTAPLISAQVSLSDSICFVAISLSYMLSHPHPHHFPCPWLRLRLSFSLSISIFYLLRQAPCPAPWVLNSVYDEGDQVTSFDHLLVANNIYECNPWPWNHLCGQAGFQPGQNEIGEFTSNPICLLLSSHPLIL
jgi:hypothetical protein